jgi:hypothetical protein
VGESCGRGTKEDDVEEEDEEFYNCTEAPSPQLLTNLDFGFEALPSKQHQLRMHDAEGIRQHILPLATLHETSTTICIINLAKFSQHLHSHLQIVERLR